MTKNTNNHLLEKPIDVRKSDIIVLDVSSRHGTPAPFSGGDDVVNFADAF